MRSVYLCEIFSLIAVIILCVAAVGISSSWFLGDDNPIEESCEDIIEDLTGKSIDLTPNTPETNTRHHHIYKYEHIPAV